MIVSTPNQKGINQLNLQNSNGKIQTTPKGSQSNLLISFPSNPTAPVTPKENKTINLNNNVIQNQKQNIENKLANSNSSSNLQNITATPDKGTPIKKQENDEGK